MGKRRKSRELAMQALFCIDMLGNDSERLTEQLCDMFNPSEEIRSFYFRLVRGVMDKRPEIDKLIEKHSSNWKLSRMACVDRNLIRIAVYELLHCEDIPARVAINEAVDIGKKYSTDESGAFINGILDSICRHCVPGFSENQDTDINSNQGKPLPQTEE